MVCGSDAARRKAAASAECPPETLEQFLRLPGRPDASEAAAANPSCPPGALRWVVEDNKYDEGLLAAAVSNPNCPPDAAAAAAASWSAPVRRAAAAARSIPADTLEQLASDDDWLVRDAAMSNRGCDPQSIARWASEGHRPAVRNPSCPPGVLAEMLADSETLGRLGADAAGNPSAPAGALAALLTGAAGLPADAGPLSAASSSAAANPSCPPGALAGLAAADEEGDYLFAVASNPSSPPEAIAACARSPYPSSVAAAAARHPNCPAGVLARIADRSEGFVWDAAAAAAAHPSCPPAVLAAVLCGPDSGRWEVVVRAAAFANPSSPARARKQAGRDPFFCSRQETARRRWRGEAREDGRAVDRRRQKVYNGEWAWRSPDWDKPVWDEPGMRAVADRALSDPDMLARYPHIAEWAGGGLDISDDPEPLDKTAIAAYFGEDGRIVVRPGSSPVSVLHEIAHKIVEEDPRHRREPLPAFHGPEFTAAMLDLVEARYGHSGRAALRASYEQRGAPLDPWDAPLGDGEQAADPLGDPSPARVRRRGGKSAVCGHPLEKGRTCRHRVAASSEKCSAGHPAGR